MLIEQRVYTVVPGKLKQWLQVYETYGVAVHTEILGCWLGCYVSEIGTLNQITHLWGFPTFEERLECRAKLTTDPRWAEYLKQGAGLVSHQENRILMPAKFTPEPVALKPILS
jgi:hypothetical protein